MKLDILGSRNSINQDLMRTIQQNMEDTTKSIQKNGLMENFSQSSRVEELVTLDLNLPILEKRIETSQYLSTKIEEKINLIPKLQDLMNDFKDELKKVRSTNQAHVGDFQQRTTDILDDLEKLINIPSLLGGGEVYNQKTVDFSLLNSLPTFDNPDYGYALGAATGTQVAIDDEGNKRDISSFVATDPCIEQFIRSIKLAQMGDPTDPTDPYFADAMDLLDYAQTDSKKVLEGQAQLKKDIDKKIDTMKDKLEKNQSRFDTLAKQDPATLMIMAREQENAHETAFRKMIDQLSVLKMIRQQTNRLG